MKRMLWISLIASVLVCGAALSASAVEPLKIGVISPVSGNYGDHGALERAGMEMALKELGGKIGGRPVEFVVADDETNPDSAARRVRSLAEKDGIKIVMGGVSSSVCMAVAAVATERNMLYIATNGNSDELSSTKAVRNMFRSCPSVAALGRATATYAAEHFGKKWFFLTHDYSWGHSGTKWGRDVLKKHNGTDLGEIKVPMGTRDFSAQLMQLRNTDADVVFITIGGFDNVALLKQLAEYRIHDKMKVVYSQQEFCDVYPLKPEEHRGYYGTEVSWDENDQTKAATKTFHEMFPKAVAPVIDNGNYNGYVAVMAIAEAVEKVGNADDVDKLICAMEGMEIKNNMRPKPTLVDPRTHQFLSNVVVVEGNGKGTGVDVWKILQVLPAVQFDMTKEENPIDISCSNAKK